MPTIAVSACLLGEPCRYDARSCPNDAVLALAMRPGVRLVPICPEVAGGLKTPRPPAEIVQGRPNPDEPLQAAVGEGSPGCRLATEQGSDVTAEYFTGALLSLAIAQEEGCEQAILKSKSPSCGSGTIYDGTFSHTLVPGWGVTAALFAQAGIPVVDESYLE